VWFLRLKFLCERVAKLQELQIHHTTVAAAMVPYFAYGSNMSAKLMRRRCPEAVAVGPARLVGWRFVVTRDGFASIVRDPGEAVYGVLWQLSPRDTAALNAYESLDSGLYSRRVLPVRRNERITPAVVYMARSRTRGRARAGYQRVVVDAAREWGLPERYVRALERWSVGAGCARTPDVGEIA
jgi:AIG2-like family